MIARCIFATCALASGAAFAASVTCASDPNTDQYMCVNDKGVRASSDKQVREAALYGGGPNSVKATGHTARVFCSDKFVPVLELRVELIGRDVWQNRCEAETAQTATPVTNPAPTPNHLGR